jgi:centromeric protein E
MELEEERESHKERDQCIKEEQMKIDNLNTRATSSDRWCKSSSQV